MVEVMQHKGDSECLPASSPADEFCGFEKLPYQNFGASNFRFLSEDPDPRGFIRDALKDRGSPSRRSWGVNPHRFGLIASTDTHLGTPGAVREVGLPGPRGGGRSLSREKVPEGLPDNIEFNPGGLVGVWAEENTRDSLFASMQRREVFGTSGPRLSLRFFGGWDFDAELCGSDDFTRIGYERGVPMGGEMSRSAAPFRQCRASPCGSMRDPGVAGSAGTALAAPSNREGLGRKVALAHERVYDVAGNPKNGASVDPRTCEPRGAGADELCTVWSDPDFDPEAHAFYYARAPGESHLPLEHPAVQCRGRRLQRSQTGFPRPLRLVVRMTTRRLFKNAPGLLQSGPGRIRGPRRGTDVRWYREPALHFVALGAMLLLRRRSNRMVLGPEKASRIAIDTADRDRF